jgi:hypothetical protein
MPRQQLLEALLDKPQYQSLYLHSASFHSSIDLMLSFIPGWVSSIAQQALEDERRKEEAVRRIEEDQPELKWYLEEEEPPERPVEIEVQIPAIELGEDAMTVIHEIQAESEEPPGVMEAEEFLAALAKPVRQRRTVKGKVQPPMKKRSTARTKKASPVRKAAQKSTKAQKKRVPVSRTTKTTGRRRVR